MPVLWFHQWVPQSLVPNAESQLTGLEPVVHLASLLPLSLCVFHGLDPSVTNWAMSPGQPQEHGDVFQESLARTFLPVKLLLLKEKSSHFQ